MSLVAYDSSGDSEEESECDDEVVESSKIDKETLPKCDSDTPETNIVKTVSEAETKLENSRISQNEQIVEPHISDEEDDAYFTSNVTQVSKPGLNLPAPKYGQSESEKKDDPTSTGSDVKDNSLLLGLPVPKMAHSQLTVLPSGDDELEELVKPKAAELASREKPPPKKKKTIKIAAPILADYDSDEDEPAKKKPKSSQKGSGLFALLPEPKHVTKKEVGRVLIPHTLTKRPPAPKPAAKPATQLPKPQPLGSSRLGAAADFDSDQEDDDKSAVEGGSKSTNFFAIGSEDNAAGGATESQEQSSLSASSYSVTSSLSTLPPVAKKAESAETSTEAEGRLPGPDSQFAEVPLTFKNSDAPLQFKSNWNSVYGGAHKGVGSHCMMPHAQSSSSSQAYNLADVPSEQQPEELPDTGASEMDILPPEELLRLQGKRQWGKEAINIIDVKADHKTNPTELTKNLTEEVDMHSHSRKNKELPSHQQKRKHQITYLAHQAKEREFDLKNQWANNRMTKQQTQSKYGF